MSSGTQDFDTSGDDDISPVGTAVPKLSARLQASGEAKYSSDMSAWGAYHACFVYGTQAGANLESMDASVAMTMPGVVDLVTVDDIPGINSLGSQYNVFWGVGDTLPYVGAQVACIVADTAKHARAAAKAKPGRLVRGAAQGAA